MKHFLRPFRNFPVHGLVALALAAAWLAGSPAHAQALEIVQIFESSNHFATHAVEQGYLGVDVADVDAGKTQALKLKGTQGALITLIDHDAPAGQVGLKVNDVVLQLNGQDIDNSDQLRKLLKDMPPGRKVSLEISRDGALQTLTTQLADRRVMEHDVWDKIGSGGDLYPPVQGMGVLTGGSGSAVPGGFHFPFFGSTLKVGALVEPLTTQMAAYLGVQSGLMVKQVAHTSEAETAGLRAFDVILKVGSDLIATSADWDRALRANQGKPVLLTILRNKKQQQLTLQVDSKRHHQSQIEHPDRFVAGDEPMA